MKALKKIIIGIIVVWLVFFIGLNIFALTQGKALLSSKLSQILGQKVEIGSLYIIPPYSVSINSLRVGHLLTVDKIKLEPSISGLFLAKFGLNKLILIGPKISIVRDANFKLNIQETIDNIKSKTIKTNKKSRISFFVKDAILRDGRLSFKDQMSRSSFDIIPIDMSVITSLRDFKTRINLDTKVVSSWGKSVGEISATGWLNFLKKDMDVELSLDEVDLAYFSVFFENFLNRVKSGKLLFSADMVSKDNDLKIDCHLETRNVKFKKEPLIVDSLEKKITALGNLSGLVLDNLIVPGGGGIFDFSIRTKFDRPRLEGLRFKGSIFKETIKNIIKAATGEGKEGIEKIEGDFKKIGKELKEQFKDLKGIFKKLRKKD